MPSLQPDESKAAKPSEHNSKGTKRPETSPDLFTGSSKSKVASSLPLWEASNILTQRKQLPWVTDPEGRLRYTKDIGSGQGAIHFWVTENTDDEYPVALAGAAALAVINTFDIRAACMHLIYAAHATNTEQSWEQEIVIDDRQIENYLGLKKRTDKSRKEKLKLIEEIAKQPCKITTYISWQRNSRSKKITIEEGRLWHILGTRYHYQEDLFGNKEIAGITFIIKPGQWAKYFLGEDSRSELESLQRYGTLSKALLENVMSIWQHHEGAARLMVWLMFKTHLNQQQFLSVQALMGVAYGHERIETARGDNQLRKKLTNTWDDDLITLSDMGWKIEFDPTTYSEDIRPPGFGRNTNRRPRGFFETLIAARILLSPPDDWSNELTTPRLTAGQETVLQTPASLQSEQDIQATWTGEDVRRLRQERGWSQRKLSKISGISQGLISMIETGSRSITIDNQLTLQRVFEYL